MKHLIVFLIIAAFAAGCRECKQDETCTLCFENNTIDNISVTVEGFSAFTVFATNRTCYSFPEGRHNYSAHTMETFPTTWSGSMQADACEEGNVKFIEKALPQWRFISTNV